MDPRSLFASPLGPSSSAAPSSSSTAPSSSSTAPSSLQTSSSGLKRTYLKLLIPAPQALNLVGRYAVIVDEIASRSNAKIKIFPASELLHEQRVVTIHGCPDNVMGAIATILDKVFCKDEDEGKGSKPTVSLIIPRICCGTITGKDDVTITSLVAKSCANIKISQEDGGNDRLVSVTGGFEAQLKAIELILEVLIKDVNYQPNLTSPLFPYRGVASQSYGVPQPHGRIVSNSNRISHEIGVPDSKIAYFLRDRRANINRIQQETRTRIAISDKGVFNPRTSNRIVTIIGTPQDVQAAEIMILKEAR